MGEMCQHLRKQHKASLATVDSKATCQEYVCIKRLLSFSCTRVYNSTCLSAGNNFTIVQRSSVVLTFATTLAIIGGSNTRNLQSTAVPDLTLATQSVSSDYSWLTEDYTGFTYTPKAATYAACDPTDSCEFAFYAIDLSTSTASEAKACRFSMTFTITPIAVPTVNNATQLYTDYAAASVSVSKATFGLLALLAVPAFFLLGL